MNYRVTVLTPTLIGDGQRLAPIDYMVWKDQINVLDQQKIFRLLSKGPRLDGYLEQIKRAQKLDFKQWGGYAQNYAARRVAFESAACTPVWEQMPAEDLFIPTFARNLQGPYAPGSALKGALRTLMTQARVTEPMMKDVVEKSPRRPGRALEDRALGSEANDRMRAAGFADSQPFGNNDLRVYQVRVVSLTRRGNEIAAQLKPGAKFIEMAQPGTEWTGSVVEPSIRIPNTPKEFGLAELVATAHEASVKLLEAHLAYAERWRLAKVAASLKSVMARAAALGSRACVLQVGWGGGMLSKSALLDPGASPLRELLERTPYQQSLKSGLGLPKTRKVVFAGNEPASIPGLVLLELE